MNIMPTLLVALLACLCGAAIGKSTSKSTSQVCKQNKVLINGQCTKCPDGQGNVHGKCKECKSDQGVVKNKCFTCSDYGAMVKDGTCVPCKTGQYMKDGKCVCDEGKGLKGDRCQTCGAREVVEDGYCKECRSDQVVWNLKCRCPPGQKESDGSCTDCPSGQLSVMSNGTCAESDACGTECESQTTSCNQYADKKESCGIQYYGTSLCRCRSRCQFLQGELGRTTYPITGQRKTTMEKEVALFKRKPDEYDCYDE